MGHDEKYLPDGIDTSSVTLQVGPDGELRVPSGWEAGSSVAGVTITSADGVVASFMRDPESGELVEVDPADAIIGVHIDGELRQRWLTVRDAEAEGLLDDD